MQAASADMWLHFAVGAVVYVPIGKDCKGLNWLDGAKNEGPSLSRDDFLALAKWAEKKV